MQAYLGTIMCKFDGDPPFVWEKKRFAQNVYILTDGRTDDARRMMAYSSFRLGLS